MKFFRLDVYRRGEFHQDPERFRAASLAYRAHLLTLRGVLPDRALELAEPYGEEGALIVRAVWIGRDLRLVLRGGNLLIGYYDLSLLYRGAGLSPEDDRTLRRLARETVSGGTTGPRLAYHEVDVADGEIEHRLLFDTGHAFTIRCAALEWKRLPRESREFSRSSGSVSHVGDPEAF